MVSIYTFGIVTLGILSKLSSGESPKKFVSTTLESPWKSFCHYFVALSRSIFIVLVSCFSREPSKSELYYLLWRYFCKVPDFVLCAGYNIDFSFNLFSNKIKELVIVLVNYTMVILIKVVELGLI